MFDPEILLQLKATRQGSGGDMSTNYKGAHLRDSKVTPNSCGTATLPLTSIIISLVYQKTVRFRY